MATKTFKIGEWCIGGVLTVQLGLEHATVINKKWGSLSEIDRIQVVKGDSGAIAQLDDYLNDKTSSYYADKVIKYITSKIDLR